MFQTGQVGCTQNNMISTLVAYNSMPLSTSFGVYSLTW